MDSFEYKIVEHLFDLPSPTVDWVKEVNLISWNGRKPVYDIRTWSKNHVTMGKGISLTEKEWNFLKDMIIRGCKCNA